MTGRQAWPFSGWGSKGGTHPVSSATGGSPTRPFWGPSWSLLAVREGLPSNTRSGEDTEHGGGGQKGGQRSRKESTEGFQPRGGAGDLAH